MKTYFDYCIVGAGLSGLVMAERLTAAGKRVVIVEKRSHIGGNCHDQPDVNGVLYHVYGPHYFRTNNEQVRDYLSRFTDWLPANYHIKVYARGRLWSFPVNLETFEQWLGQSSNSEQFAAWLDAQRVPVASPENSEQVVLSQVGREFYELFFKGYTLKQWNLHPRDLAASVCGRIPMRLTRDSRYFSESFQAMPKNGYSYMFNRMLEACAPRMTLLCDTDFRQVNKELNYERLIYTGPIDAYFDYQLGVLPWRSLRFELVSVHASELDERRNQHGKVGYWQEAVQINHPEPQNLYTRTVEVKHVTGQCTPHTNVVFEYSQDFSKNSEPYYPVPGDRSLSLYENYKKLATKEQNVLFLGRLATYRYLNMDQVVEEALRAARGLG